MAPGPTCSERVWLSNGDAAVDAQVVTLCVLFPFNLAVASYFIRSLLSKEDLQGYFNRALLTYITLSSLTLSLTSVGNSLVILTGWGHTGSLAKCATFDFTLFVCLFLSYLSMIEVLVLRVQCSFSRSVYAVSPSVIRSLHCAVGLTALIGIALLIARAASIDCFMAINSGSLGRWGIAPDQFFACSPRSSQMWIGHIVVFLSLSMFISSTIMLGYVFVSRMRLVNSIVSRGPIKDRMSAVILKSMILVGCSIISTLVVFILTLSTGAGIFLYLDLTLNQILMLCMVKSGERLYSFLFGGCVRYLQLKYPQFSESLVSPNHTQLTSISDDVRSNDSSQVCE